MAESIVPAAIAETTKEKRIHRRDAEDAEKRADLSWHGRLAHVFFQKNTGEAPVPRIFQMIHLHRRHRRSILEAAFEGGVAVPRSPRLLIVAGLLGFMFFWLTDPRFGAAALAAQENAQEIVNQSSMGSIVGMAGSAVVLVVGISLSLWRTT